MLRRICICSVVFAVLGCAEESIFTGERSQGIAVPERSGGPTVIMTYLQSHFRNPIAE